MRPNSDYYSTPKHRRPTPECPFGPTCKGRHCAGRHGARDFRTQDTAARVQTR